MKRVFLQERLEEIMNIGGNADQAEPSKDGLEQKDSGDNPRPLSTKALFLGCLPLPLIILATLISQQFGRHDDVAIQVHIYNTLMILLFTAAIYFGGVFTVWLLYKAERGEDTKEAK